MGALRKAWLATSAALLVLALTAGVSLAQTSVTLNGTVKNAVGHRVPDVSVTLSAATTGGSSTTVVTSSGQYSFSVAAGTYRLRVTRNTGDFTLPLPAAFSFTTPNFSVSTSQTLNVTPPAAQQVTVRVRDPGNAPETGAYVTTDPLTIGSGYSLGTWPALRRGGGATGSGRGRSRRLR
jgi:hypothetical protein